MSGNDCSFRSKICSSQKRFSPLIVDFPKMNKRSISSKNLASRRSILKKKNIHSHVRCTLGPQRVGLIAVSISICRRKQMSQKLIRFSNIMGISLNLSAQNHQLCDLLILIIAFSEHLLFLIY